MLDEIKREAEKYIGKLISYQNIKDEILNEVRWHKNVFVEAIVLVHINGNLTPEKISKMIGHNFTENHMDVVSDFFLRDILMSKNKPHGRSWTGSEILSDRQMTIRRNKECFHLDGGHYVDQNGNPRNG